MLEAEGVEFRDNGTIDLERFRWQPRRRRGR
jgi:alkylated DNA nucleotide flippase Atl1